jgi:isopenicillin-N N-acyltransferase-like protein
MTDCNFPHIVYSKDQSCYEWGKSHGEHFSQEIRELAGIRRELMLLKNPGLKGSIDQLAKIQYEMTKEYSPSLTNELDGIIDGSKASLSDIIILNNYTDFRDISLADEGCTTVGFNKSAPISAQTWDMHASAKRFLCSIELPCGTVLLSLVGCLGMMGANDQGLFVGVNNLNTNDAENGIIWSALVRSLLEERKVTDLRSELLNAPVTSGHNYLISDGQTWQHYEISPSVKELQQEFTGAGVSFHTNHCLSDKAISVQDQISVNSTTFERYAYCEQNIEKIKTEVELLEFLKSHDGYPKSICSHYQSGAEDPSTTCGGGLYNHKTKEMTLWRGCQHEDDNYIQKVYKVGIK